MEPTDFAALVVLMAAASVILWLLPSCGDPECRAAHTKHSVEQRAARIERDHAVFHGETQPDPMCALCQARKRDRDA